MCEKNLNQDSICLLKECDAGCKMATESMEQILDYVSDERLKEIIKKYNKEHIDLGEEIHQLLNQQGEESKEPNPMAKIFSKISSDIKMMVNADAHQAASILIDGCNMGIKSLSEYKNRYKEADMKSVSMCEKLQHIEKEMVNDLQVFL